MIKNGFDLFKHVIVSKELIQDLKDNDCTEDELIKFYNAVKQEALNEDLTADEISQAKEIWKTHEQN